MRLDHAIDRVTAAAANSNNLDLGAVQQFFVEVNADVVAFRLLLVVEVFNHRYLNERVRARFMLIRCFAVEYRAAVPGQILPNVLRALLGKQRPDLCAQTAIQVHARLSRPMSV